MCEGEGNGWRRWGKESRLGSGKTVSRLCQDCVKHRRQGQQWTNSRESGRAGVVVVVVVGGNVGVAGAGDGATGWYDHDFTGCITGCITESVGSGIGDVSAGSGWLF